MFGKSKKATIEREYTYAELVRMTKKRVIRIAGFKNIKELVAKGYNNTIVGFSQATNTPIKELQNASKKWIARQIAVDK